MAVATGALASGGLVLGGILGPKTPAGQAQTASSLARVQSETSSVPARATDSAFPSPNIDSSALNASGVSDSPTMPSFRAARQDRGALESVPPHPTDSGTPLARVSTQVEPTQGGLHDSATFPALLRNLPTSSPAILQTLSEPVLGPSHAIPIAINVGNTARNAPAPASSPTVFLSVNAPINQPPALPMSPIPPPTRLGCPYPSTTRPSSNSRWESLIDARSPRSRSPDHTRRRPHRQHHPAPFVRHDHLSRARTPRSRPHA